MKFLIATGIYPPDVGGPATVMADLAARLRAAGHTVDIVTYGDASTESEVHRVSRRGSVPVRYWKFFRAVRSRLDSDATLLATDVFSVGIPSRFALIGKKNRFLIRLGGEWCWEDAVTNRGLRITLKEFWRSHARGWRLKFKRFLYRRVLRRASKIFLTSELLYDAIRLIDPNLQGRILVTRNESRAPFNDGRTHERREHAPFTIAYIGRFAPVKNVLMLARVLRRLYRNGVVFKAVFVGSGPEEAELRSILADIKGAVFRGALPHEEAMEVLRQSDLLALPSLSDICPNVVLEALALGVPCVITREHGLPHPLHSTIEIDPHDEDTWQKEIGNLLMNEKLMADLQKEISGGVSVGDSGAPQLAEEIMKFFPLVEA